MKTIYILFFLVFLVTSCKNENDDSPGANNSTTDTWEMTIQVDITDPEPSPFTITGEVDIIIDGNKVSFTGDFVNGNLTFEDVVFEGTLNGNTLSMTTTETVATLESDGTVYTENISWEMDPFPVQADYAATNGTIIAVKTPGNTIESGTFSFVAEKVK